MFLSLLARWVHLCKCMAWIWTMNFYLIRAQPETWMPDNWVLVLNPRDKNLEVWIQETKRACICVNPSERNFKWCCNVYVFVSVWVYRALMQARTRPEEGVWSIGAGGVSLYALLDVGAGNQAQALWKSSILLPPSPTKKTKTNKQKENKQKKPRKTLYFWHSFLSYVCSRRREVAESNQSLAS